MQFALTSRAKYYKKVFFGHGFERQSSGQGNVTRFQGPQFCHHAQQEFQHYQIDKDKQDCATAVLITALSKKRLCIIKLNIFILDKLANSVEMSNGF